MVIATGLGPGRGDISIERVAINVNDARIPDNLGAQPIDIAVVDGGPAAYFSTLPIKGMVKAVREAGITSSVSQTAGTFVCNQVFYRLQHALAGTGVRSGFIHVPGLPGIGRAVDGVIDDRGRVACSGVGRLANPGGYRSYRWPDQLTLYAVLQFQLQFQHTLAMENCHVKAYEVRVGCVVACTVRHQWPCPCRSRQWQRPRQQQR